MADIIEVKRRFFHGLDADKPAAGANGDRYYATDKNKLYYWTAGGWKTGLGYEFVELLSSAAHKQVGDFTTNGVWQVNGLDLSAIVPAGAKAIVVHLNTKDDAVGSIMQLRRDAVNVTNSFFVVTQVANIDIANIGFISVDSDRLIDYFGSNLAFTVIDLTVLGWFI